MHPEDLFAVRVLKVGAAGYLSKVRAEEELLAALRTIAKGAEYISPPPAEHLGIVLAGTTVGEIARNLYRSVKAISILLPEHGGDSGTQTYSVENLGALTLRTSMELSLQFCGCVR